MKKNKSRTCSDCGGKVGWYFAVRCRPCRFKYIGTPTDRFKKNILKTSTCWLYTGYIDKAGYGIVWDGKKLQYAHRFSWELENGPIPNGMKILHRCDVRKCVFNEHLFIGTQLENIADCVSKGRNTMGEKHPKAILTEEDVKQLRSLHIPWNRKASIPVLSKRFGISPNTAYQIIYRKIWKHI